MSLREVLSEKEFAILSSINNKLNKILEMDEGKEWLTKSEVTTRYLVNEKRLQVDANVKGKFLPHQIDRTGRPKYLKKRIEELYKLKAKP